tara:strand:- start:209 stop:685 length:477 start_codon:yes stop_codon:yes gene_type:complete
MNNHSRDDSTNSDDIFYDNRIAPLKKDTYEMLVNCPYCAEEIKKEAIKCRHCGESLEKSNAMFVQNNINERVSRETTVVIERSEAPDSQAFGIVSFVVGLIGIFFISFILSPIALGFGIAALNKESQKVWGILGIIFSIIGMFTSIVLIAFIVALFNL